MSHNENMWSRSAQNSWLLVTSLKDHYSLVPKVTGPNSMVGMNLSNVEYHQL